MEETKTKIIIADYNREFCNILKDYLLTQKDMVVTGIAENGVEVLRLIEEKNIVKLQEQKFLLFY